MQNEIDEQKCFLYDFILSMLYYDSQNYIIVTLKTNIFIHLGNKVQIMTLTNPEKVNTGSLVPIKSKVVKMMLTSRMQIGEEHQKIACDTKLANYMDHCPEWLKAKDKFDVHQNCLKHWFDKKSAGAKSFDVGDLVLKWDKPHEEKGKQMKF